MGIDLTSIAIKYNCTSEQFRSQVTGAALALLRMTKSADRFVEAPDQRTLERGSEEPGGGKSGAAAGLRPL